MPKSDPQLKENSSTLIFQPFQFRAGGCNLDRIPICSMQFCERSSLLTRLEQTLFLLKRCSGVQISVCSLWCSNFYLFWIFIFFSPSLQEGSYRMQAGTVMLRRYFFPAFSYAPFMMKSCIGFVP